MNFKITQTSIKATSIACAIQQDTIKSPICKVGYAYLSTCINDTYSRLVLENTKKRAQFEHAVRWLWRLTPAKQRNDGFFST